MSGNNPTNDIQRLDDNKFNELNDILGDDFTEIVNEFSNIVPESLINIDSALKSGDTEKVFMEAHTLKSSSGNLGLSRFSHLCAILEEQARNNIMSEAETQLDLINTEFTEGVNALRHKLEE